MTQTSKGQGGDSDRPTKNTIKVLNRSFPVPATRRGRVVLGSALVVGGLVGFLPVVGFWMLPLGLVILAQDIARVRRWRRKLILRFYRNRNGRSDAR